MEIGIYVRIKRDEKWQSLDINELTEDELNKFFSDQPKEAVLRWLITILKWIKENVKSEPVM